MTFIDDIDYSTINGNSMATTNEPYYSSNVLSLVTRVIKKHILLTRVVDR